ncbi:MAG: lipoyl(octanoyl) transferase LipB [Microthrixaceae bacterium]
MLAPGAGARPGRTLRTRWLGRVGYSEALALQRGIHRRALTELAAGRSPEDHLLLVEHPHTYTLGRNADRSNVLTDPASVGAELIETDRGGDVTYHGPGQLVAYPLVSLASAPTPAGDPVLGSAGWVHLLEDVVLAVLEEQGIAGFRRQEYPGVWVGGDSHRTPAKIAAVGVRLERGRTLHGVALNVGQSLWKCSGHIVPCGITDGDVTSSQRRGGSGDRGRGGHLVRPALRNDVGPRRARPLRRRAPPELLRRLRSQCFLEGPGPGY